MPRLSRIKSKTGIYHVMLKGINQQLVFEDDEDNEKFLDILRLCKEISGFELYGYCLMGNHIHLLIKTGNEELDQIFKRIGARYVYWFNWKYKRSGHLFHDRFKSEPVEDDTYLLTVLRYIHRNPIKAKLCMHPGEYKWSSYNDYIDTTIKDELVDTAFVKKITGSDELVKFTNMTNNDDCLEVTVRKDFITDGEAKTLMMELCKCDTIESFQKLNDKKKSEYIKYLSNNGISIRQLIRITGISKGIIEKYRNRQDG